MTEAALIGADWGTSSLRVFLLGADGRLLDRRETASGIMAVAGSSFEDALAAALAGWPVAGLPILLSGMIGSRQGWHEAPYVPVPADAPAIAGRLVAIETGLGTVSIVPGIARPAGDWPDVMRGEETQVFGALAAERGRDGVFVLPGTHCKWVRVDAGTVTDFRTYMTGELFAALRDHTILGRLMTQAGEPGGWDGGFAKGVAAARHLETSGALLARLFSIRALGLFDRLAGGEAEGFLSGLLIGAEIVDACAGAAVRGVTIIANERLTARYLRAFGIAGVEARTAPPECGAAGLVALARAAGLMS